MLREVTKQEFGASGSVSTVQHEPGRHSHYTASNAAFANRYQYGLAADDTTLMFMCGTDPNKVAVPTPASALFSFLVGACSSETLPFTDEAHLAGTYQCSAMGLDALWDFAQ